MKNIYWIEFSFPSGPTLKIKVGDAHACIHNDNIFVFDAIQVYIFHARTFNNQIKSPWYQSN